MRTAWVLYFVDGERYINNVFTFKKQIILIILPYIIHHGEKKEIYSLKYCTIFCIPLW